MSFSFGQPASSGSTGSNLFGTAGNSSSGLFGSGNNGSNNLFGSKPASTTGSVPISTSATSATSLFGASTGNAPSLFGSKSPSTTQASGGLFGTGSNSGTSNTLFSTPNKSTEGNKLPEAPKSLFGGGSASAAPATGSLFAPIPSGSSIVTPAASKTTNLFSNPSTTPAGAPPENPGSSTPLFSSVSTGGFNSSVSQKPQISATGPNSSLSNKTGESKPAASLFSGQIAAPNSTASSLGNSKLGGDGQSKVQSQTGNSLFKHPVTTQGTTNVSTHPIQSSQDSSTAPLLGAMSNNQPGSVATTQLGVKPDVTNSAPNSSLNTTLPPNSSAGKPLSFFANAPASAQLATVPAPSKTSGSTTDVISSSNSGPAASGGSSSGPAPASGMNTTSSGLSALASDRSRTNPGLSTSVSGPKPIPQSRLKNKSMDEIITRWATDLQKYQKEFHNQASKVAEWDRILVTSSDQIQKLYGSTLEAERATAEVERQLSSVEHDQSEIEYWLEHYEKQIDELTVNQGSAGSFGEGLQGPDAERERTFKMAERLNDRLTEMGKDLGSMIEEINDASQGLSRDAKGDDPLSQIVKVLNGHLSQLQVIDQGTTVLQAKVTAAQNESRGFVGNGNLVDDNATDDFYRSYMGRM